MKLNVLTVVWCFIVFVALFLTAEAEPEKMSAKSRHVSYVHTAARSKFRTAQSDAVNAEDDDADDDADVVAELRQASEDDQKDDSNSAPANSDASSGRLFMKKFLLFKNMFGTNQKQPIIPIIITGAGGGTGLSPTGPTTGLTPTGTSPPTTTITTTGTVPTATGTITTEPMDGANGMQQQQQQPQQQQQQPQQRVHMKNNDADDGSDDLSMYNQQALQVALAAGAQEYVVTDEEIKGTSDGAKASRQGQQGHINLRLKSQGKRGKIISVRVPSQYRRYFKNGQKVMLNAKNRRGNRRVVKKRVNKNRRRRINKNRRTRIVPA